MRLVETSIDHFKLRQYLLFLGVSIFVTTIFWIGYSIYAAFTTTTIDSQVEALTEPLNPTLDEAALEIIQDRFQPPAEYLPLTKNPIIDDVFSGTGQLASPSAQVDLEENDEDEIDQLNLIIETTPESESTGISISTPTVSDQ